MKNLSEIAVQAINIYKKNKTIMDFVEKEAYEKVAEELRSQGASCTYKAVKILMIRHKYIEDKVKYYINAGLVGCYMASLTK